MGRAIVVVPHDRGSKAIDMQFKKYEDIDAEEIPLIAKEPTESIHTFLGKLLNATNNGAAV